MRKLALFLPAGLAVLIVAVVSVLNQCAFTALVAMH